MMKLSEKILDLFYPENLYCICCGDTVEQSRIHGLCDSCASKISWVTQNPFKNQMDDFAFDGLLPCCYYGFHARRIISKIKLSGSPYAAKGIGLLMGERLLMETEAHGSGIAPDPCDSSGACSDPCDPSGACSDPCDPSGFSPDFCGPPGIVPLRFSPDAIVAVPMHKDKMLIRGYNQAELLAHFASEASGIPHWEGALTKIKPTSSMRLAGEIERRQMLEDTFIVSEGFTEKIKGRHLILLDDVITTGSTADAAARALLSGGASRVDVLCFAVSPNKGQGLR